MPPKQTCSRLCAAQARGRRTQAVRTEVELVRVTLFDAWARAAVALTTGPNPLAWGRPTYEEATAPQAQDPQVPCLRGDKILNSVTSLLNL